MAVAGGTARRAEAFFRARRGEYQCCSLEGRGHEAQREERPLQMAMAVPDTKHFMFCTLFGYSCPSVLEASSKFHLQMSQSLTHAAVAPSAVVNSQVQFGLEKKEEHFLTAPAATAVRRTSGVAPLSLLLSLLLSLIGLKAQRTEASTARA